MIGAIIGDMAGSRFEFDPTNDYNFELFTEESSFTDDTVCTVAVAEALLKGRDHGGSIHAWRRCCPHPMDDHGGRFALWGRSTIQGHAPVGNRPAQRNQSRPGFHDVSVNVPFPKDHCHRVEEELYP